MLKKLGLASAAIMFTFFCIANMSQQAHAATTQTDAPWGLDRIDQTSLPGDGQYHYTSDGTGVTIYLIDSGVRADDPEFGGRVIGNENFVANGDKSNGQDCDVLSFPGIGGHGTASAALAAGEHFGVAKGASIYSLQVVYCDTLGESASGYQALIKAFNRVIALQDQPSAGRAVVHYTGFGTFNYSQNRREFIAQKITELTDIYNIPVVIPASGSFSNNDPAITEDACLDTAGTTAPNALVVGAALVNDHMTRYSDWGDCVDLFAPGGTLFDSAGNVAPDPSYTITSSSWDPIVNYTTYFGGTSAAAPLVTGAVARYLEGHPTATAVEVRRAILANVTPNAVIIDYPIQETANNDMLYIPPEW